MNPAASIQPTHPNPMGEHYLNSHPSFQTKEELIRWCGERQHWLQVILIANRSDENDQKLLTAARRQASSEDSVQLLNCRLRIEKVPSRSRQFDPTYFLIKKIVPILACN